MSEALFAIHLGQLAAACFVPFATMFVATCAYAGWSKKYKDAPGTERAGWQVAFTITAPATLALWLFALGVMSVTTP